MKMYDMDELVDELGCDSRKILESAGVPKVFAIRAGLVRLKHEVKSAMLKSAKTVDICILNERLQHIAKTPRPGLPKLRCNGKCRCKEPIA